MRANFTVLKIFFLGEYSWNLVEASRRVTVSFGFSLFSLDMICVTLHDAAMHCHATQFKCHATQSVHIILRVCWT